jgi:hypothetical protein
MNESTQGRIEMQTTTIKTGATYNYRGIEVEVIGLDSDPTASVLVVETNDRDRSHYVSRDELAA